MPRYNITMPEDLWERIGEAAPAGNRSYFLREAAERVLDDGFGPLSGRRSAPLVPSEVARLDELDRLARAPDPVAARRCELDCGRQVPTSPKVTRCQCGGRLVG